ncbi:MAG: hypothetical protein IJK78_07105 [Bacteroidales bacterium]|nr:hypothetical protein [Bacteroidales bacterium]
MKKKKVFATLFCAGIFATSLILASCGGGGDSETKTKNEVKFQKSPKNEILGDLVNISCEYATKWNASEAEYEEARQKNMEKYADNSDKREQNYLKISESHKERGKQIVADANAALEKEMAGLIGKDIPSEVEGGLGFEVVECKITGITKHATSCNRTTLTFNYKVKPVDAKIIEKLDSYSWLYKSLDANGNVLLDSQGNEIAEVGGFSYNEKKQLKNGEIVEKEGWFVLQPSYANFAKIKFVKRVY